MKLYKITYFKKVYDNGSLEFIYIEDWSWVLGAKDKTLGFTVRHVSAVV